MKAYNKPAKTFRNADAVAKPCPFKGRAKAQARKNKQARRALYY